jgi:chemosensory pili system protein ChpC
MSNTDMTVGNENAITQAQKKQFETVHCLLLPLNKEIAVLPNAAVAEIIPFVQPEAVEGAPDWLVGRLEWRDRRIPLIAFETASDGEAGRLHKGCRIAVLNTLNGSSELPYIAIVMQGLPSLQVVRPNSVQYDDKPSTQRQSIKAYVNLNGTAALIPDIDDLENRLQRIHS